jgi:hypothetical protein
MVALTVPSRMTAEEIEQALHTCISFGRPCITKLYAVPAPRPVDTVVPVTTAVLSPATSYPSG